MSAHRINLPGGLLIIASMATAAFAQSRSADEFPPEADPAKSQQPLTEVAFSKLILVRYSEAVFAPVEERLRHDERPVRDVILGAQVCGHSTTDSHIEIDFKPDEDGATFRVILRGTCVSRTVSSSGPARINSRTVADFASAKRVSYVPGEGFSAMPSRTNARVNIYTEGIGSTLPGLRGRIVRRFARRGVERTRGESLAIADAKNREQVNESFDAALDGYLAQLNRNVTVSELLAGYFGAGSDWEYRSSTTEDYLEIAAGRAGVAVEPPPINEDWMPTAPIEVWMHGDLIDERLSDVMQRWSDARNGLYTLLPALQPQAPIEINLPSQRGDTPLKFTPVGKWMVFKLGADPRAELAATRP